MQNGKVRLRKKGNDWSVTIDRAVRAGEKPSFNKLIVKAYNCKVFTSNTETIPLTEYQRQPTFLAKIKIKFKNLSTKLLVLKSGCTRPPQS